MVIVDRKVQGERAPRQGRPNCGYYLRQEHRLIRRHEESIFLNPDNAARWNLRVDLELPKHEEAGLPDSNGERAFLFPLVYLRKNESRMQFRVHEEGDKLIPLPIRHECDEISAGAISEAVNYLAAEVDPELGFKAQVLKRLIGKIAMAEAFEASMALQVFRGAFGIVPSPASAGRPTKQMEALGRKIVASGLNETLELLVEHVLLWVSLRGRPNERRSVLLSQDVTLRRRSLVRWSFGRFTHPPHPFWQRRWARIAKEGAHTTDGAVLMVAGKPYGRRDRRFSSSALGERIGQPLGWMPYEFDLPTIYPKRCSSYHFEVRCPPGRTPRDLKVSSGPLLDESEEPPPRPGRIKNSRLTLTSRSARFDVPRGGLDDVARFRVTVGIGNGAFPLLWFLAGTITACMLWVLAGTNPSPYGEQAQTTAGILLIVPALIAGLAAASSEIPVSRSVGGARILLLATGLSAVLAASVLAGARPFEFSTGAIWRICAIGATVTTAPLATSWLLSSPFAWKQMLKLNSYVRQRMALAVSIIVVALAILLFSLLSPTAWARAGVAAFLLLMMILLSALANNRAGMPMGESRRYLGFAFLLVGLACLGLACVELACLLAQRDLASHGEPTGSLSTVRLAAELSALIAVELSYGIGDLMKAIADRAAPRDDEVHVSPRRGRALLARESVRELPELFDRERRAGRREKISV